MTIIAFVPALVALLGAIIYLVSPNPKLAELGRIGFFAGLFVVMFTAAGRVVRFG